MWQRKFQHPTLSKIDTYFKKKKKATQIKWHHLNQICTFQILTSLFSKIRMRLQKMQTPISNPNKLDTKRYSFVESLFNYWCPVSKWRFQPYSYNKKTTCAVRNSSISFHFISPWKSTYIYLVGFLRFRKSKIYANLITSS